MSTIEIDTPMHQDAPVMGTAIKWGLISAIVGAALTMVWYNLGMMDLNEDGSATSYIPTIVSYGLAFVFSFLGVKDYRDNANGGQLSFGRGLLYSLAAGAIAGIITAIFMFIFFSFLAPDYVTQIAAIQEAAMEEQGMSASDIEAAQGMMGFFMSPGFFAIIGFISSIILGLIGGGISSLILKTR